MIKKYLPFVFLIAAALLLFFIKKNQRGASSTKPNTEQSTEKITIPVLTNDAKDEIDGFNRNTNHLIFSKHAKCRMDCRNIDESEVREILKNGKINHQKIQTDKRGMTYPVEGYTHDKQHVRIVFAPKDDALVVVTVIDLDTEWKCDCK